MPEASIAVGDAIMPGRSARIRSSEASGRFMWIVTSSGPVASTDSIIARSAFTDDVSSVSERLRLKATASASNGVPSWNVTPSCSWSTSVWGSGCSHEVASPGTGSSVSGSKFSRRSYNGYSDMWSYPETPEMGSSEDASVGTTTVTSPPGVGSPASGAAVVTSVPASVPSGLADDGSVASVLAVASVVAGSAAVPVPADDVTAVALDASGAASSSSPPHAAAVMPSASASSGAVTVRCRMRVRMTVSPVSL